MSENIEEQDWMKDCKVTIIDGGDFVLCDMCNKDWTNSEVSGGFLFQSKAVCPDCEDKIMASIEKYKEQRFIKSTCPEGTSFYDYVMAMRR